MQTSPHGLVKCRTARSESRRRQQVSVSHLGPQLRGLPAGIHRSGGLPLPTEDAVSRCWVGERGCGACLRARVAFPLSLASHRGAVSREKVKARGRISRRHCPSRRKGRDGERGGEREKAIVRAHVSSQQATLTAMLACQGSLSAIRDRSVT